MDGIALKQVRGRLGLSQAQMAEELGVMANTIARWERGEVKIGATAAKLIQHLDSQRQRGPVLSTKGAVVIDEHHRQILLALEEHLDPEVFELCTVGLLAKAGVPVVPVVGGGDGGFDGAVTDLETGRPIPLVTTTAGNAVGNLKKNLTSAKHDDPSLHRAVFATSKTLTPTKRLNLERAAANMDVQLVQIFDQVWFAQMLYHDPAWSKRLLGLTGRPRALSRFPLSSRHVEGDYLIGRGRAIEWLKEQQGDCLLTGVPGSGKTFLLSSLADEMGAFFLVDDDRERVAHDIRELMPKAIIIDDAHTDIKVLQSLNQLRANVGGDDFQIIVTAWPGYEDAVVNELALTNSARHELEEIYADEMIEVIKAHGVTGPDRLLELIRLQARGKPGLAGTLATLTLSGDVERILSGDALLEQLTPPLVAMLGNDAIILLAHFALGGDSGVNPEYLATQTGESSIEVRSRLAKLAAAGIIHPLRDGRIVVVPEALRVALVRRVFLVKGGPSYRQALDWIANRHDGITTLIRTSFRGAPVPGLWDLLQQANSESLWAEYAKLGEREALYVIENDLSRYEIVAEQGLHYVPEVMIPILLDQMPDPWPTFGAENDPAVRALREWVVDRGDNYPRDEISVRRMLVTATRDWWNSSKRTHQALRAMSLALSPTVSVRGLGPGAGTTLTLQSFLLNESVRKAQMELWPVVLDLVEHAADVPWEELLSMATAWLQTDGVPEDVADEMRRFSEKILGDLALVTAEHPGIQSKLDHRAKAWGFDIDVLLDPLYEAAFPQEGPFTVDEDRKRAARLVRMVEGLSPSQLADKLVYLSRERQYAGHWSDGFVFSNTCQQLAHQVPDLVTFIEDLVDRSAEHELVGPFFQQAAAAGDERFGSLIIRLLESPNYEPLAVHHLLVNEDTSSPLVTDALERAVRYPFMLSNLAEFGRLNSEALRRVLAGADEVLAATAAAGYSLRGRPAEGDALHGAWRDAVVRSARTINIGDAQTGWMIKEILKNDPDLAKDWLLEWMASGRHWLDMHEDCAAIASGMTSNQRLYILERIEDRSVLGIDGIVRQLVGDDLELFAQVLKMDNLSNYRASLLAGRPGEMWLRKATLAIEAGLGLGEIAESTYALPMMWTGEESKMWAGWRQDFEGLAERKFDDPRVATLIRIAIESISEREELARAREARENVLGFGER